MADLITMPKMGFDMAEGTLVEWTKQVGDDVTEGDVIAFIETDKANVEVTAFTAGTLRHILADVGTVVPVGKAIAVVGATDEEIDLAELSPEPAGALQMLPTAAAAPGAIRDVAVEEVAAPPAVGADKGRILASPVAQRIAEELGIDLSLVQGSGPRGRIVKRDIETFFRQHEETTAEAAPPPIPTPSYEPTGDEYHIEPVSRMRRTISRRMTESKQQAPHFYVTVEVDMEAAMALRSQMNDLVPEDERLSVNDLIVKAAAIGLRQFPRLNASLAGDKIHIHNRVNIGVAVARDNGLITTVIKDCDTKQLAHIAREARELIGRARRGRMQAEDMVGGTFTISNLGMFGVEDFVAIINPPQAAILAVGAVKQVPVVDQDGQLAAGTRMKMTISADHRVTDGVEAASFLQSVQAALEQPMKLVL